MNRLLIAMGVYAGIALLAWNTLSSEKVVLFRGSSEASIVASFRDLTLAILGLLFVLTLLAQWRERAQAKLEKNSGRQ